jgi:hypothetical protein
MMAFGDADTGSGEFEVESYEGDDARIRKVVLGLLAHADFPQLGLA